MTCDFKIRENSLLLEFKYLLEFGTYTEHFIH